MECQNVGNPTTTVVISTETVENSVSSEESSSTTLKASSHDAGTSMHESSQDTGDLNLGFKDNGEISNVSSQVDQSTQTEALPTSMRLTSLIPDHVLKTMKDEVPWLINIYDAIDNRFHDLDTKVTDNVTQTSSNKAKIEEDNQYTHRNCLLVHNLNDMPAHKKGEAFSIYLAKKLNALLPNLRWMGRKLNNSDIDTSHPLKSRRHRSK